MLDTPRWGLHISNLTGSSCDSARHPLTGEESQTRGAEVHPRCLLPVPTTCSCGFGSDATLAMVRVTQAEGEVSQNRGADPG